MKGATAGLAAACAWLALAVAAAGEASAQQRSEPVRLDDITVRSTRIERTLGQVPASVSVVEKDEIQLGRQQLGLDESLARVPGVFMQNRFNFAQDLRMSIRGSGARAAFGIRGIKILVDGIPETLPDGQGQVDSIDLGSAQRIEVIRGPVSSLYGNASGGVVSIETEDGPPVPFAEVNAALGEYGYRRIQAKTGGQRESFNYLFNLGHVEIDGYRQHARSETTQLNGKLRYEFDARSDLTASVNFIDSPVSDDPGALRAAEVAADRRQAAPNNLRFDAGESLDQQRVGLVYRRNFGGGHEISVRNYYVWRGFENSLPFTGGGQVDLDRFFVGGGATYALSGQLLGRSNRLSIGFDLDYQDDDRLRFDNLFGVRGGLTFDQREEVTSLGVFIQDELQVTDRLTLTAGLRYDDVEFDVSDHFFVDGQDDSGSRDMDEWSPMAALLYELDPRARLYANVSTAFETPTTTEFTNPTGAGGFNQNLDPQTLTQYEVGVRGDLNPALSYEVAAYRIEVDDELIPREIPGQPGRNYFVNAGETTRDGLEVGLTLRPMPGLTATASYTYANYSFDNFVDENGNVLDGNEVPGTPRHLFFAELSYFHPSGVFAAGDLLRVGDFYADDANTVRNDSYTVSNLRLGYAGVLGGFEFTPYVGVNNLFDEKYNQNVRLNAGFGRYFEPAPERNVYGGVTVRYAFGG